MSSESIGERLARCEQSVEENPSSARAHYNLGLAYTQLGKMDSAERAYRKALECDPDFLEAWVNLGGTLMLKWDFEGALAANEEAARRDPDLLLAHYNKGQALIYLNDPEGVVSAYRRVLELDPSHASGHYFLAVGLLACKKPADARRHLSRSIALGYRPRPEFFRELEKAERAAPQLPGPMRVLEFPSREDDTSKEK
ncbi:MAG: tetratricopeptide repeat protein [Acidobacteria bacterium]|nr:tetratricopeptide repeat protein [Acidobacteriota bacterium]